MPRTPKPIDLQQVHRCAAIGCTDGEIAFILGMSEAQLRRRCRQALDAGRAQLRRSLRRRQWQAAMKGSVPMLIWLGKQYLGQTDRQEIRQSERLEVVEEVVFPKEGASDAGGDWKSGKSEQDPGAGATDAATGGVCPRTSV